MVVEPQRVRDEVVTDELEVGRREPALEDVADDPLRDVKHVLSLLVPQPDVGRAPLLVAELDGPHEPAHVGLTMELRVDGGLVDAPAHVLLHQVEELLGLVDDRVVLLHLDDLGAPHLMEVAPELLQIDDEPLEVLGLGQGAHQGVHRV